MRPLLAAVLLAACSDGGKGAADDAPVYEPLVAGKPQVGASEGTLKLPVGTPLAGFTSRCGCLGGTSYQDDRQSPYADRFVESTGVHIRPTIKAVWITNGDEHLVMTKTDVIYSDDGLVQAVTDRLEALTGEDLQGRVTHSGNHNHSSYGTFSGHEGLFLGHDKFNRENYERMVEQVAQVAYEAYQARKDAAIGIGWAKDWDPNDQVYSDRRGTNDDLVVWPDLGPEQGRKDPHLKVIRMDDAVTGEPISVIISWGMHPYVFGEWDSMATADATASVEVEVAEAFDNHVVAMFLQGSGGDTSVRGRGDEGWARMETVGAYARDAILTLREQTPTSSEPIVMETVSRSIPMGLDKVRVTRNGTVNWYYPPFDPDREADDIVYNPDGTIASPLDEFNTQWGAAFCGSGDFDIPIGGMPTDAPQYTACMNIDLLSRLVLGFFKLTEEQAALPFDGMESVYTATSRISQLPVRHADGTTTTEDALLGFFPGEVLSMYTTQWQRRTFDELGYRNSIIFGYSMDHEGYLLIPEDWLRGEYEPDITFWGPLAGEYIMEQVLHTVDTVLGTDVREGPDPAHGTHEYPVYDYTPDQPDPTPDAGTVLTADVLPDTFWIPDVFDLDLTIPDQIRRVDGMIQLAWKGGDAMVDNPRVTLERYNPSTETWEPHKTPTGRIVNEDHHDFALAWTPDPLFPKEADQSHLWWTVWQAVDHVRDRAGLPLGTYRLHVEGHKYAGGSEHYPWNTEPYEVMSKTFEVLPAEIAVEWTDTGVWLSLEGPEHGFRMVDIDGFSQGHNPLRGSLRVTWTVGGSPVDVTVDAPAPQDRRTFLPFPEGVSPESVRVLDMYDNEGMGSAPVR